MGDQAGEKGESEVAKVEARTGKTPERWNREERNGRNRGLSSQNRKRSGRKKAEKEGERPKAKAEGKHRWNSCGSETGKDERKQTESQVPKTGKEGTRNQAGENGENVRSESGRRAPGKLL